MAWGNMQFIMTAACLYVHWEVKPGVRKRFSPRTELFQCSSIYCFPNYILYQAEQLPISWSNRISLMKPYGDYVNKVQSLIHKGYSNGINIRFHKPMYACMSYIHGVIWLPVTASCRDIFVLRSCVNTALEGIFPSSLYVFLLHL